MACCLNLPITVKFSYLRNEGAMFAIKRAMKACPELKVTLPNLVEDSVIEKLF